MGQAPNIITVEQLLAAEDLPPEAIDVPEWGGQVKVRGLSVKAINQANRESTVAGEIDEEKIACAVVIAGMVEPQLTNDQAGQLAEKSMAVINRIVKEIYRLSGLDESVKEREAGFREGSE